MTRATLPGMRASCRATRVRTSRRSKRLCGRAAQLRARACRCWCTPPMCPICSRVFAAILTRLASAFWMRASTPPKMATRWILSRSTALICWTSPITFENWPPWWRPSWTAPLKTVAPCRHRPASAKAASPAGSKAFPLHRALTSSRTKKPSAGCSVCRPATASVCCI